MPCVAVQARPSTSRVQGKAPGLLDGSLVDILDVRTGDEKESRDKVERRRCHSGTSYPSRLELLVEWSLRRSYGRALTTVEVRERLLQFESRVERL